MINYVKEKGLTPKVVIMTQGDADMETDLRNATMAVTDAAGVEFKQVVVTTDSSKQIEAISSAFQADPSWNIWIAHTGEAGVSAATVFSEAGVVGESVFVAGIDGTSTHLANLADGTNVCILEQNVYSAGYKCIYAAADWLLNGKLTQFDEIQYTANAIIDASNYDQYKAVNDIVMEALGDIH
jgi:ABC-type sugar transport system substrate-binding protein